MSDTPRTEEAIWQIEGGEMICPKFSRQLERELNAANERIKRLEEDLNELRSDEARLLNSNGELERRIKLLEEAGDLMVQHFYTDEPRSEMWEKAKEAKP